MTLRVHEIFHSLQGESSRVGLPTVFVRLTGCPMRCVYCDAGYSVSLETGGAIAIGNVDPRVSIILDIKTPDSGEMEKNCWSNLEHLKPTDEVKFVLCGREDYEWARQLLADHKLHAKCTVLFSPVYGRLDPTKLGEWVLQDRLPVRMQVQLHKILWGETPGK